MAQLAKFKRILKEKGISEINFDKEKTTLSKKFNKEASDSDVIWSLFNKLVGKEADLQELKMLYFDMALFLNDEDKDSAWVAQLSNEMELRHLKEETQVVNRVEILSDQCCEECNKLNKQVLSIEDAIEKIILPNPNCINKLKK